MKKEYRKLLDRAISRQNDYKHVIPSLKKKNRKDLYKLFEYLQNLVFSEIDCTLCANCCRKLGPRLKKPDIKRMSKTLSISEPEFINTYLRLDKDDDFVFSSMPCPFIGYDNLCILYESRPRACREYPHMSNRSSNEKLETLLKNSTICPAVSKAFEVLWNLQNIGGKW